MGLIDLLCFILDALTSWRFFLCAALSIGIAAFVYFAFSDQVWVWFISISVVVIGVLFGLHWEQKALGRQIRKEEEAE